MNIGPSDKFQTVLNDFHVTTTGSTTFYVNCTLQDPPVDGPIYFGYSGDTPFSTASGTTFFSINGSELSDVVSQGYLSFVSTADGQLTISKQSGYSSSVTTKVSSFERKRYAIPSQSFWRFQSDAGTPLRVYRTSVVTSYLITQVELIPDLEVFLLGGKFSYIEVPAPPTGGASSFGPACPFTTDSPLPLTVVEEVDVIVIGSSVLLYIFHDSSII